jgi:hypothetical protein
MGSEGRLREFMEEFGIRVLQQESGQRRRRSMRGFRLLSIALPLAPALGSAQEPLAPRGDPPRCWLASAFRRDGKVAFSQRSPRNEAAPPRLVGPAGNFQ